MKYLLTVEKIIDITGCIFLQKIYQLRHLKPRDMILDLAGWIHPFLQTKTVLIRNISIAIIFTTVITLLLPETAEAQDKQRLAVLKFVASKNIEEEADAIAEELRADFVKSNLYMMVDRTVTEKIFEELAFQQSGATDQKNTAKIGHLYSVKRLITGKLNKIGTDGWQVSAVMIDAETGTTSVAETVRYKGDFFNFLNERIPALAHSLMKQVVPGLLDTEKLGLNLLIFPPHFSGNSSTPFSERREKADATVYSALRQIFGEIQLKSRLQGDPQIDSASWYGFFNPKPNEQYMLAKSREMKTDLAVIYSSSFGRDNRSYYIALYDVSTGARIERKGSFPDGSWAKTLRQKTCEMAEEYRKTKQSHQ
jgi:hypothetical protein